MLKKSSEFEEKIYMFGLQILFGLGDLIMKKEFEIPDSLVAEMARYHDIDWNAMVVKAIEGMLYDFSIIEKLKEFWGTTRK